MAVIKFRLRTAAYAIFCVFLSHVLAQPVAENEVGAYFRHKTVIIPHDEKKHRGGEDAAGASDTILVVADGVGGWAKHKVNPGLYSKLLTETIIQLAPKNQSLLELVHEANWIAASKHLGSATCTVLKVSGKSTISALNIGDSGYSIHRINKTTENDFAVKLLFSSEPGQRQFNFPYQIGGKYGDVVAEVAQISTHEFQDGDIIIVYSDGVSDNLYPEEFHPCIENYLVLDDEPSLSYSLVADCIARTAYWLGKDPNFNSPFAKGARAAGWGNYKGGKHDDISVVVAQIFQGTKVEQTEMDPHFPESVHIYTGRVPPVTDLPRPRKVFAHQEL